MGNKNVIGSRIKQARKLNLPMITQKELASRMQTKGFQFEEHTISKIEHGDRKLSDIEIIALTECLDISISWLFNIHFDNRDLDD